MTNFKYLLQFILIIFLFSIFKIIGLRYSSILSEKIFILLGPLVRSENLISKNLSIAFPNFNSKQKTEIQKKMWSNYGKIFAEYMFIKDFRKSSNFLNNIIIENQNELDQVKTESKPVIFVSGHFNNFELMAMYLEKSGIDVAAIYRPLNNKFLNPIMERIRKNIYAKNKLKRNIWY